MIATSNGDVITNNHVVAGATKIMVTVQGRGRYQATVVGTDKAADVAVLKLPGLSDLPTVRFGDSSSVRINDGVVAIGNALGLGGSPTVTSGTITSLDRSIAADDDSGSSEHLTGMLQTDAQIQPGNSGGPLANGSCQVIGMNTAAASASSSSPTSVGFAIPSDRFTSIASKIESGERGDGIIQGLPAFLGIEGQTTAITKGAGAGSSGAGILYVKPGGPAASAGIVAGDVIVAFDGSPTPTIERLATLIQAKAPGSAATVTVQRSTGRHSVTVHLTTGPAA